jgi:hypothetical protein
MLKSKVFKPSEFLLLQNPGMKQVIDGGQKGGKQGVIISDVIAVSGLVLHAATREFRPDQEEFCSTAGIALPSEHAQRKAVLHGPS